MKWNKQEEQTLLDLLQTIKEEEWVSKIPPVFAHRSWDSIRKKIKRLRIEEPGKPIVWFAYPDIHFGHEDSIALAIASAVCDSVNPDIIILLGDLIDCEAPSKFSKSPDAYLGLQSELNKAKIFLQGLRLRHPNATIYYKEGNHELRIPNALKGSAMAFYSLDCLRLENLLDLDYYNIKFIEKNTPLIVNNVVVTHGEYVSKHSGYSAKREMEARQLSGISGHTHRISKVTHSSMGGDTTWVEAGCLCDLGPNYVGDKAPNWQQGFVVGYQDPESLEIDFHPIQIKGHKALWDGVIYS